MAGNWAQGKNGDLKVSIASVSVGERYLSHGCFTIRLVYLSLLSYEFPAGILCIMS